MIDEYSEILEILKEIERQLSINNVFISGSAEEYGEYSDNEAKKMIEMLSAELIKKNFNIISGFGIGIGSSVITGALNELYMNNSKRQNAGT